ncbi:hypothetical protein [Aliarcobacter butzleri]|uniref:hypothetical protein n=1 Tax=Aliarcobacter butzleri TaxID=28197 RepID=UPI003AF93F25
MNRLDFSKELNKFSFSYNKKDSAIFDLSDESQKRIYLSRLYYALYHRVLTELPKIKELSGPGGHITVVETLAKQVNKGVHYERLYFHYKDLKKLREWADYKIEESLDLNMDFSVLFQKTNSFIKSNKLIA